MKRVIERRLEELEVLRKMYGSLEHGPNVEWIVFKEFRLPSGWNKQTTELLVVIPAGYPATPPDNFYVAPGLLLASGSMPANFSKGVSLQGRQWDQFSYHLDGGWKPAANVMHGDNLQTFILKVLERLRELN